MKTIVAALICFLLAVPASAQIKQWTDADGVTHFANTAPAPIEHLNYHEAMAAILSIMKSLELPAIDPTLVIYADGRELETGLTRELGLDQEMASRLANSTAFAQGTKILINESRLSRETRPMQIKILAHELTHLVEYAVADFRYLANPGQWLLEGFAEWLSYDIVKRLNLATYAHEKFLWRARYSQGRFGLTEMLSLPEWMAYRNFLGGEATYGRAHLATDFLIQRSGIAAVLHYFALFSRSSDREANFVAAFGLSHEEFEREFNMRWDR